MLYVQRDSAGNVTGVFTAPQPQPDGTCLTQPDPLPENHPEILGYLERTTRVAQKKLTDGDLAAVLVKAKVISQDQVDAALQVALPASAV